MFAIKSLSNYIFGNNQQQNIAEIPQGQYYIVRPLSSKHFDVVFNVFRPFPLPVHWLTFRC